MIARPRPASLLFASALAFSGCFGTSNDKGDNGGSLITPKPGGVEDANTAGTRKSVLPEPGAPETKAAPTPDAGPK